MEFYCDEWRHLVCVPYTVPNLHAMAATLGIKRCWFHARASYAHYDIPKTRVAEIQAKCKVVTGRDILAIVQRGQQRRFATPADAGEKGGTKP